MSKVYLLSKLANSIRIKDSIDSSKTDETNQLESKSSESSKIDQTLYFSKTEPLNSGLKKKYDWLKTIQKYIYKI